MKTFITSLALFISICGYSQKLLVTPDGLKDEANPEKTFVVLHIEGKTAKQLYDSSINFINKNYKNPEKVIKGKVDADYLSFDTYGENFISIKNGFSKTEFNAKYTIKLSFKDAAVRFEIIDLDMENEIHSPLLFTGGGMSFAIYNKKGELKKADAKKLIEDYFNSRILDLSDYLSGKLTEEKW